MRKIIILLFLLVPARAVFATTSCADSQSFIGFSADGSKAYWEEKIGGECDPAKVLHLYDFRSGKSSTVKLNQIKKSLTVPPENFLFCEGKAIFVYKDRYLKGGPGASL